MAATSKAQSSGKTAQRSHCDIALRGLQSAILLSLYLSHPASAEETTLKILLGQIPYVLHDTQPGPHNQLIDILLKKAAGPNTKFVPLPYIRAARNFAADKADCLYVSVDSPTAYTYNGPDDKQLLFSNPVNRIYLRAITRAADAKVKSLKDLKAQVVIGVRDQLQEIEAQLRENTASIVYVQDIEKAFELFDHPRGFSVITFGIDGLNLMAAQSKTNQTTHYIPPPKYHFDYSFSLRSMGEVMACWASPASQKYLARFNNITNALQKSGRLEEIFSQEK